MSTNDPTAPSRPAHLDPSELGTKEYWDNLYTLEISNNISDPSDTGTNWFDDSNAQDKVISYLSSLPELSDRQATSSILDLGTGNGELLFGLREDDWMGPILGVDYSAKSIELAKRIEDQRRAEAEAKGRGDEFREVKFQVHDMLHSPPDAVLQDQKEGWDIVLDKGTFDAISLSSATDEQGHRVAESYRPRVLPLVKERGLFVITSCNWTETELETWFTAGEEADQFCFEKVGRVEYKTFSFGGVKGQTISTLCFRKVRR